MNLCNAQAASPGGDNKISGGGCAAPAPLTVGAVGFGPAWEDQPSLRELYETACQSIVRQESELSEASARIALLEQEQTVLAAQARAGEALGLALAKTIGELKAERVELKATIESLRDALCADKCRDKAAADGGWANI
jgi:cell division protein FtsB